MNVDSNTDEKSDFFNNDVLYMYSLIGKTVQITLLNNEILQGIVYVIDPIYKNIVIHERSFPDLQFVTKIVLYHAIKSMTVLPVGRIEQYITKNEHIKTNINSDTLKHRKKVLKECFQNMYLHVEESGDCLKIDDNLVILPPYGPENCICNNTLILERIQNIMISMPFIVNS